MKENSKIMPTDTGVATIALQHVLVSKGIISFDEISQANLKAKALFNDYLAKLEANDQSLHPQIMIEFLADTALFIGGERAKNAVLKSKEQIETALQKAGKGE